MRNQELKYNREAPIELKYEDESIGYYKLDFIIEEKIVLELKARRSYHTKFFKQVLAYLRSTGLPLAIVANFGKESLEYKRVINSDCDLDKFVKNSD